jgi:hypothetical protein
MGAFDKITDLKEKLFNTKESVVAIVNNPWPQTQINPEFSKTIGFLPPFLIPVGAGNGQGGNGGFDATPDDLDAVGSGDQLRENEARSGKYGHYEFTDWTGQTIDGAVGNYLDTNDRFKESLNLPKQTTPIIPAPPLSGSVVNPYSMRDHYMIFDDNRTDYFKHGLQVIDGLTPIENPEGDSDLRLSQFKYTPFENNDPVMYGFDLIIDGISSPLLNGSVIDFLNQYQGISELAARIPVYEDFKQQFLKFFKTKGTLRITADQTTMSTTGTNPASVDNQKSIYQLGKKAYMGYYIQKIAGLKNLVEANKPGSFKYVTDYRKDVITLDFLEDVSLSVGTLAHLYKLLYWSKPNGKSMVPENLLRFNCDIVVSECRNFNRVKKAVETGNLEIIKDNVSRYVYSLRECQFFFDQMPHPDDIDMGNISTHTKSPVTFDYKYSTVKFEKFVPTGGNGFGSYVGYDSGAIWKIGNPGARGTQSSTEGRDTSVPKFFTVGQNKLRENGVKSPFVFQTISKLGYERPVGSGLEALKADSAKKEKSYAKKAKERLIDSAKKELQGVINTQAQLLARTLNKAAISLQGGTIPPPRNIYKLGPGEQGSLLRAGSNVSQRFFYDVRGDLVGFLGDSLGGAVGGG